MRFFSRYRIALAACALPLATFVLAYAPAAVCFGMAVTAAAGWCFWLDQHPTA